ncbi:MAG: hypothetical protein H6Q86_1042 [candidate division NC10 bacterium]|jgi:hypothetical protein|nr:hypothetical protein [candidate division NC10 bacterium]
MPYELLADAVLFLHLSFILFVVLGGLLALKWPWVAWAHLPAAAWGAVVEIMGWICPLTPLEITLRRAAGSVAYDVSFVERYLVPIVYPSTLTREMQMALGLFVLAINLGVYSVVWRRRSEGKQ